jgi:hypothetical protein
MPAVSSRVVKNFSYKKNIILNLKPIKPSSYVNYFIIKKKKKEVKEEEVKCCVGTYHTVRKTVTAGPGKDFPRDTGP